MAERDSRGRFPRGTSGNRRGRPKSANRRLETPDDLDDVIIEVMNLPTTIRTSAGEENVPLFKATMLRLATGKAENRLAAVHAIHLMRQATWSRQQRVEREEKWRRQLEEQELTAAINSDVGHQR